MSTNVIIEDIRLNGGVSSMPVEEQKKPVGENNVQGYIETQFKPSVSVINKPSIYSNFGSAITENIKNAQGAVFQAWGENLNASVVYLQFHNTTGLPAGGAVPVISIPVPASSVFEFKIPFGENGQAFTNGIAMAWSTTAGTYTAVAGAGDQNLQVNFI